MQSIPTFKSEDEMICYIEEICSDALEDGETLTTTELLGAITFIMQIMQICSCEIKKPL